MGLKGIHSPKTLHQCGNLPYCPWCRKEEQNEGMVINHLQTVHYCLGLVCASCLHFFATSIGTMRWHAHACMSMATEDKDWEEGEESEDGKDSDEDDGYLLEEIES